MGYRLRTFLIVSISMGIGVLFSNIISVNSDIPLLLVAFSLFIIATISSIVFANFSYKSISNLEALAAKIADGSAKKGT